MRKLCVGTLILCIGALLAPSVASADDILRGFTVTPTPTGAGLHPDITVAMELSKAPGPHVGGIKIHFPAGMSGNANATDRCSEATFRAGSCPASTQIGAVEATAAVKMGFTFRQSVSGEIYNLEPPLGNPAQLGIVIRPPVVSALKFFAPITIRSSDGGLDSTIDGLPTKLGLIESWLESLTISFFGTSNSGNAFITNPTSCIPAVSSIDLTEANSSTKHYATSTFTPTNCQAVPFEPTFSIATSSKEPVAPSAYTVRIGSPPINGRAQASLKAAEVKLPAGTTLNSEMLDRIPPCASSQTGSATQPSCPLASAVGRAAFTVPSLGKLSGFIYKGFPTPDNPYPLLVGVTGDGALLGHGVRFESVGKITSAPQTGQLSIAFGHFLQLPLSEIALTFGSSQPGRGFFKNPTTFEKLTATARLTPWSAAPDFNASADRTVTSEFTVSSARE